MTDNPDQSGAEEGSEDSSRHVLIDLTEFRQQKAAPPSHFTAASLTPSCASTAAWWRRVTGVTMRSTI